MSNFSLLFHLILRLNWADILIMNGLYLQQNLYIFWTKHGTVLCKIHLIRNTRTIDPFSPLTEIKLNGLRTHNEGFFHLNPKLLGLSRQFWANEFSSIWGIFGRFISTHFGTVSPLSMFYRLINHYFYKPLYPNSKYLLGIGIWIWATKN